MCAAGEGSAYNLFLAIRREGLCVDLDQRRGDVGLCPGAAFDRGDASSRLPASEGACSGSRRRHRPLVLAFCLASREREGGGVADATLLRDVRGGASVLAVEAGWRSGGRS